MHCDVDNCSTFVLFDFDCSRETELFRLDILDDEGKPIVVRGQLNDVDKPKSNNIDIFVKHIFVETDNYDYKVEGWINVDNFELEIGRNRVYEDARIYPEFRKKFYEYLDKHYEKASQTVEKEVKGIKQLQEMANNLIKHFCELNPEMIAPLISGSKASQGIKGKHPIASSATRQEKWNQIKGIIDVTDSDDSIPGIPSGNGNGSKGGGHKGEGRTPVPVLKGQGERKFVVRSTGEYASDNNTSVNLKFVPLSTNQDDPVIYFQPPNRIVINTARPSSDIILSGNSKDPTRKEKILPLLTMAIIDMFPSSSELSTKDWKKTYGQLLDKAYSTC